MNRKIFALVSVIAIVFVGVALSMGSQRDDAPAEEQASMSNAEMFKQEYPLVSDDNPFVYSNGDNTVNILESESGVVMLGFKECPWCQQLAPRIEEAAKAEGLDEVYYLDIRELRAENDEIYQKLVGILEEYLEKDEDGNPRISVPDVTVVHKGEVVGRFEQEPTAAGEQATPESYWTEERSERAVLSLRELIRQIQQ